jgi:hypothetical protein
MSTEIKSIGFTWRPELIDGQDYALMADQLQDWCDIHQGSYRYQFEHDGVLVSPKMHVTNRNRVWTRGSIDPHYHVCSSEVGSLPEAVRRCIMTALCQWAPYDTNMVYRVHAGSVKLYTSRSELYRNYRRVGRMVDLPKYDYNVPWGMPLLDGFEPPVHAGVRGDRSYSLYDYFPAKGGE